MLTKLLDVKTNALNIIDVFRLAIGVVQSFFLLKRLKPASLLLKGGFVCVPVALSARLRGVPYITHDSDALPGLSNRLAARWAKYHATALPAKYYSYPAETVRTVGVPTDIRFREYSAAEKSLLKEKYGFPPEAQVLLITGGSNGARRLNSTILQILPQLLESHPDLRILHQVGQGNEDQLYGFPKEYEDKIMFFGFSSEIFHMSAIADVIVARAGASAIADYAAQSKACIVVPNPFLTGGHQLKNAQVYAQAKAALIVNEKNMNKELPLAIEDLLKHPEKRAELSKNLHSLVPPKNAAAALADLIGEIAR